MPKKKLFFFINALVIYFTFFAFFFCDLKNVKLHKNKLYRKILFELQNKAALKTVYFFVIDL